MLFLVALEAIKLEEAKASVATAQEATEIGEAKFQEAMLKQLSTEEDPKSLETMAKEPIR